tara:strand:+ start:1900 stop:2067 length:168 start_codon:yes stop_codon:yes gene_type:complete
MRIERYWEVKKVLEQEFQLRSAQTFLKAYKRENEFVQIATSNPFTQIFSERKKIE